MFGNVHEGKEKCKKHLVVSNNIRTLQLNRKADVIATAISVNINMPRKDMAFVRQLGKRMGWTIPKRCLRTLYDPESETYFNEETMQAIRDVESGNVKKCKSLDEILATL